MKQFISNDIWIYISELLCYVDQYALRLTSRDFSNIIKQDFKKIIDSELSKHMSDIDDFYQILMISKAVISGSFIIACLYGTSDYNDIDIFDILDNQENRWSITKLSNYLNTNFKNEIHKMDYGVYIIRNFNLKDITLQHISTRTDSISYIDESFDLDICKSYFDGKKLVVKSWDKLIARLDFIKPSGLLMQHYANAYDILEQSTKRVNKYKGRGFDIKFHPEYYKMTKKVFKDACRVPPDDYFRTCLS